MRSVYRPLVTTIIIAAFLTVVSTGLKAQPDPAEKDVFSIGMGFGGGLGGPGVSLDLLPGYTGTISPGFMFNYEHVFEQSFGIGAVVSVASASLTATNIPYTITDPIGHVIQAGTLEDQSKGTYIGVAARPLYHFKLTSTNFDAYAGLVTGFTFNSISSTVTTSQGVYPESGTFPGLLFGVILGGRYYFTKNIGIWAEAGYCGMPDYLINGGITVKLGHF